MAGAGAVVQASPEELRAFSSLCSNKSSEAATSIDQVVAAVNSLQGQWEGLAADKFGAEWGRWQADIKKFPEETTKTSTEMSDYAQAYELMDQQATTGVESVG
jgi:WXG100 family type VII secretion target